MQIGSVTLNGFALLAPMAGVTDEAYRSLCARFGAAATITEMVSAKALHYHDKKTPELMHLPQYLSATAEPATIRPGRTGKLHITLDSEKLRNYGLTQTDIYLSRFPGDRVNSENQIYVSATLLPELNYSPAERANAPRAHLDSTTVHLGPFGKKDKLKTELVLTNTGKSPLKIQTLQVYNPGLSVSFGRRTLKPGQSEKLKITVSARGLQERRRRRVLLITNDPEHPKIVIDLIIKK